MRCKKVKWRKVFGSIFALLILWYVHPLVWKIPGIWYLPLPLACEYGDYDSAKIRALIREAKSERDNYIITTPDISTNTQSETALALNQYLIDFVARGQDRDEVLARVYAFSYALGGTVTSANPNKMRADRSKSISILGRINLMNLGSLEPIPFLRTGYFSISISKNHGILQIDSRKLDELLNVSKTSNISNVENRASYNNKISENGYSASFGLKAWNIFGPNAGQFATWGIVNDCVDAERIPKDFHLYRIDLTKTAKYQQEFSNIKIFAKKK